MRASRPPPISRRRSTSIATAVDGGERFTTLLGATGTGKTMTMAGVDRARCSGRRSSWPTTRRSRRSSATSSGRSSPTTRSSTSSRYYDYYQPEAYVPTQGPLHREGLGDQPGGRPPAPRGDGRAVRAPRRDHRRVGLGDLRPRLAGDLRRATCSSSSAATSSTATSCCASSSRSSTRATTPRSAAAPSACAARRSRSSRPTPRRPTARRSSATRSSACSSSTR